MRHALDLCFSTGAEARGHGHADWREAAATALQALLAWPASDAFREPVDPGYAAYHKVGVFCCACELKRILWQASGVRMMYVCQGLECWAVRMLKCISCLAWHRRSYLSICIAPTC